MDRFTLIETATETEIHAHSKRTGKTCACASCAAKAKDAVETERIELAKADRSRTLAGMLEAADEKRAQGTWVPACGGTEEPFRTRTGRTLLYCYQASTGKHAYLDIGTDTILTDSEAWIVLGHGS